MNYTLDLRALEIFRAVAHEGSVSRAAVKLSRVQSNVSTRIRQLEDAVGKPLFLRKKRGLILTPDGELLLGYAERFMQLSEETSEAMASGKPAGHFRIGALESSAAARLPEVLSRYHARYPDVEIELETGTAGQLVNRLSAADIEVAFIAGPQNLDWMTTLPVFSEQLMLVAPKSAPALGDFSHLSGQTIVAFEPGCAYRRHLEQW